MSQLLPNKRPKAHPVASPRDSVHTTAPEKATEGGIAKWRLATACAVALAADMVFFSVGESLPVVFDVCVGVVLLCLLGAELALIPALALEMIPGVGLFPSWSVAVGRIAMKKS